MQHLSTTAQALVFSSESAVSTQVAYLSENQGAPQSFKQTNKQKFIYLRKFKGVVFWLFLSFSYVNHDNKSCDGFLVYHGIPVGVERV